MKPHRRHKKKLTIMVWSILFNSFFPSSAMIKNTITGPLHSQSPHIMPGVATLCDRKIKTQPENNI